MFLNAIFRRLLSGLGNYRSEDLIKSLNLRLGQHIFLETGDIKHQINLLLVAPDMAVPARVVEYLTH